MNYVDIIEQQLRAALDVGDYDEIMRLGAIVDAYEQATKATR